ncbi:type I glyceraldehyde-3-phosphate dehydrogenase [Patescibacteria group bacterium]|nr:type I glyceraldehyde-3-phosphate dehydrogenase [Patescibacteria group bacterium]
MKKVRIGINGFGRIGRNALKVAFEHRDACEIVGLNDLTSTKTLAQLLKHDTAYGEYKYSVTYDENSITVDGHKIHVYTEKDPAMLPWGKADTDVVIESTGRFLDKETAGAHLKAGAKRVIISAPSKGNDPAPTHVMGVNPTDGDAEIINNASCTTNCITPVMAVLEEEFGIEKALMSTIHSYTQSQMLQDGPAKDIREARAAAQNIVPTSTGAAIATTESLTMLKGKFDGLSFRVPTIVVSISDITAVLKKNVTVEEINDAMIAASKKPRFAGILDVSEDELVSSDFKGNSHSAIVDLSLTRVIGGNFVKVVAWYDNEWGYSNRLVEQAILLGQSI